MDVPFVLQVGGVWIPLTGVQREVPRTRDRGKSEWFSMSNRRRVQYSSRSARTWKLTYEFKDPSAVAWLAEAAAGQAGPVFLLDRAAAQMNMLDRDKTAGRFNGQPSIATALGIQAQTLSAGVAFVHPLRGGFWYHLSGWSTAAEDEAIGTILVGGVATQNVFGPDGAGPRPWSTAFYLEADQFVSFSVAGAGKTTRLRLTEGSVDTMDWYPGQNTPCRVAVSDPDEVLSLYRENHAPLSSYTVELAEVG